MRYLIAVLLLTGCAGMGTTSTDPDVPLTVEEESMIDGVTGSAEALVGAVTGRQGLGVMAGVAIGMYLRRKKKSA